MAVNILESKHGQACFYCTSTDWAFGPVMGSPEEAEAFLKFLPSDPRSYEDIALEGKYYDFVQQYVCECGAVADGIAGQDEEEVGTPIIGYPRTDGERFQCDYCKKKAVKSSQQPLPAAGE